MKKICYLVFLLFSISCNIKINEQKSRITKIEENTSRDSSDEHNDLKSKSNTSEVINDSISDSQGMIYSILEKNVIKEKFVEYHGDSCNDVKFNLRCYQSQELLFNRTINKEDFSKFFEEIKSLDNVNFRIESYVLTGCDLDSVARNPLRLTFRLRICKPMSANCFNFILKFDDRGNYTITSDTDRDNNSM